MRPQPPMARQRSRINQYGSPGKRSRVREVRALGVERGAVPLPRQDHVVDRASPVSCAVDERLRRDGGLGPVRRHSRDSVPGPATIQRLDPRHVRQERAVPAAVLEVALQVCHERVAVNDARRVALHDPGESLHLRFPPLGLLVADEPGGYAEGLRELVCAQRGSPLLFVLRDDPFLRVAVGDASFCAEVVHHLFAADAEFGFEGVGPVVDPRMDYLTIQRSR